MRPVVLTSSVVTQVALVGRLQDTGLAGADVASLLALRAEAAAAAEVRIAYPCDLKLVKLKS